jgi:hypothetical protein
LMAAERPISRERSSKNSSLRKSKKVSPSLIKSKEV